MIHELKRGDRGERVRSVQRKLQGLSVDGIFGPATEQSVARFQLEQGVERTGVVDVCTLELLRDRFGMCWQTVPCHPWGEGYAYTRLREDAADALEGVKEELNSCGAMLTSSGGRRLLSTGSNASRSAKSLHYVGRAHDLFVHSAMSEPHDDPYVVEREGDYWRVYARCPAGVEMELEAWVHKTQHTVPVKGRFLDLTELMQIYGFQPIKARSNYPKIYGNAEWWHFQWEEDLVVGETTFGDELLKLYSEEEIRKHDVWRYRNAIWGQDWS